MTKRTVKADASWSGSAGGGILGPNNDGLGFGDGSQGIGHSTNLPPGFGGSTGSGTWSGSVITDEPFDNRIGMEKITEWDTEELINQIKALIKIGTPDSLDAARELKFVLDKRMFDLRRARRAFELIKTAEKSTIITQLKSDPFVVALFAEHGVEIDELDKVDGIPTDLNQYAIHDLVHTLTKTAKEIWELIPKQKFEEGLSAEAYKDYKLAWHELIYGDMRTAWEMYLKLVETYPEYKDHHAIQVLEGNIRDRFYDKQRRREHAGVLGFTKKAQSTQQPIKGKCPESGATRYMSVSDLVQHDYKAPCPEGRRRLEKIKSVSIEEYKKHKSKKKSKKHKKASSDNHEAMEKFFEERTAKHIDLTKKYLDRLEKHYPHHFEEKHDESKYGDPEHEPYLYITWKHKCKDEGEDYEIPDEWKAKCDDATFHHIKNNKHHPEYWDDSLVDNPINKKNRDEPSGKVVNATKMPDKNVLEMVADWCAMSEEKSNTPKEWAEKNIGVRWDFTPEQEKLIYEAIDLIWNDKTEAASAIRLCKAGFGDVMLPADAEWYSPDGGFSRIWMVSETGHRAFWKVKGQWREIESPYWARGNILSSQSPSVKQIREQFFGEELWDTANLKSFTRKAIVEPFSLAKAPLPRPFKSDVAWIQREFDGLKRVTETDYSPRKAYPLLAKIEGDIRNLAEKYRHTYPNEEDMHPDILELGDTFQKFDMELVALIQALEKDALEVQKLRTKPSELMKRLEQIKAERGELWVDHVLQEAQIHLPEMGEEDEPEGKTIERHLEFFSTEGLQRPLTAQDFYDFYAASLSIGLLDAIKLPEGWAEPAREEILTVVNQFADKLLRAAKDAGAKELAHVLGSSFSFKPTAEGRYQSLLDRVKSLEDNYTTVEEFNKLRSNRKLAFDEMSELFRGEWGPAFGGGPWADIMKEAAKLQSMLPATAENIGPIFAQIDHVVDLEHNTDTFLSGYVDLEGVDKRLNEFLSEKTEKWDLDMFQKHSPKFYNLYKNLQKYASIKHRFMKTAKATITFTPEEQQVIDVVKEAAQEVGIKCYLVGGAVRDRVLGKENVDLDFMCEQGAEKLAAHLAKKYNTGDPVQYDRSQAIMVPLGNQTLDFINAEKLFTPLKQQESLEGEEEFTTSFDDAYRRDLTINTLMYDIATGELLDPTGKGLKDLRDKKLNTVIDPFIKYKIHAADMLRALRFAATLGFEMGPRMLEAMRENAERVRPRDVGGDISNRRVRRELRKAIDKPEHWAKMLELLQKAGLDIVLAKDIEDVQKDFIGGIDYHFDNEDKGVKAMRIRRFTKQAGLFDVFKQKKEEGPLKPTTGAERIKYLAKNLDDLLRHTHPSKHEEKVIEFLSSYPRLSSFEKEEVRRRLNWYKGHKQFKQHTMEVVDQGTGDSSSSGEKLESYFLRDE